jgi:chemotaxis protein CheC
MIGTPVLAAGDREVVGRDVVDGLLIETDFTFLETTFEGVFVLSHAEVSFASLLRALGFKDVAERAS